MVKRRCEDPAVPIPKGKGVAKPSQKSFERRYNVSFSKQAVQDAGRRRNA